MFNIYIKYPEKSFIAESYLLDYNDNNNNGNKNNN